MTTFPVSISVAISFIFEPCLIITMGETDGNDFGIFNISIHTLQPVCITGVEEVFTSIVQQWCQYEKTDGPQNTTGTRAYGEDYAQPFIFIHVLLI